MGRSTEAASCGGTRFADSVTSVWFIREPLSRAASSAISLAVAAKPFLLGAVELELAAPAAQFVIA